LLPFIFKARQQASSDGCRPDIVVTSGRIQTFRSTLKRCIVTRNRRASTWWPTTFRALIVECGVVYMLVKCVWLTAEVSSVPGDCTASVPTCSISPARRLRIDRVWAVFADWERSPRAVSGDSHSEELPRPCPVAAGPAECESVGVVTSSALTDRKSSYSSADCQRIQSCVV
jgi:hypothetical protein